MDLDIPSDILLILGQHINDAEVGVAVLDSSGGFRFYNRAFACMFSLETGPVIGLNYDEIMTMVPWHDAYTCTHWPTLRNWLDNVRGDHSVNTSRSFEACLTDGRWILITQQSHNNGMLVTLCTDISRKKQIELELRTAHEQLQRLAMTDDLTSVPNRRHFLARLEQEYIRINRHGQSACLAMVDLDHFKRINDSYGHAAGDEVLKHFAGVLCGHTRAVDLVGRIGGEEFALLLPETTQTGATAVLERMKEELNSTSQDFVSPGFTYTFSAGIAEMVKDSLPYQEWMRAADEALYRAKAGGRNRVVAYGAQQ